MFVDATQMQSFYSGGQSSQGHQVISRRASDEVLNVIHRAQVAASVSAQAGGRRRRIASESGSMSTIPGSPTVMYSQQRSAYEQQPVGGGGAYQFQPFSLEPAVIPSFNYNFTQLATPPATRAVLRSGGGGGGGGKRRAVSGSTSKVKAPVASFSFVNFTASDADTILSGVAPSGSSKRRREEEEEEEEERCRR